MTVLKASNFFKNKPVFRHEEFVAFLKKRAVYKRANCEAMLAYHVSKGNILRIRQGLYTTVRYGLPPTGRLVDPYLLCAKISSDAVLSHHTAMQFHGVAYSEHFQFPYWTRKSRAMFQFHGMWFVGARFPSSLLASNNHLAGVDKVQYAGMDVRVTNRERTFVDALARPDLCGGWEEVWRTLESIGYCDLWKLVDYALMTKNATVAGKVGFFLEQHRDSMVVTEDVLKELSKNAPKQPCYMDRHRRKGGKLVHPWQLMVPPDVLYRSWEEPFDEVA